MKRYFFLHLQKTAGTSIWKRLHRQFADRAIYPGPADGRPPDTTLLVDHLQARWRERGHEIELVTGHFPLCTTELLDANFTTFTILREPIDRIVSALRHQQQGTPEFAEATLEEIYDEPVRNQLIHNHMTKMLSLTVDEMHAGAFSHVSFTDTRTQQAMERLDTIDVVGFQHDVESFADELQRRFGWDLGPPTHVNRTRSTQEIEARFRDRLVEENAADLELYAHALRARAGSGRRDTSTG